MNYKDYYSDILKNKPSSLYIFTGEEYYLMKLMVEKTKENIVNSDIDYYYTEEKYTEYRELYSAISLFPFTSTRRVVVINNADYIFSSKWTDKQRDSFLKYHKDNDTLLTILVVNKLDLRKKSVKTAKNYAVIVKYDRLLEDDYKNFIVKTLSSMGYKIKSDALRSYIKNSDYLLKDSKCNLFQVVKELEVISSSSKDNYVDIHDVRSFVNSTLENNLWKWREAVVLGDSTFALNEMEKLIQTDQHPILLCYMVCKLLSDLINIQMFREANYSTKEIATFMKSKEFVVRNGIRLLKSLQGKNLTHMLKLALETDDNMKVGGIEPKIALETLIFKLSA